MSLATVATFGTVYRTIGLVLAAIVILSVLAYAIVNVRFAGKEELGSELELAANRKPYYDDETLEGAKLDRTLSLALLTLFVLAIGLPLYWIMEPARQDNAALDFQEKFVARGAALYAATGDNAQALNCAGCHGGVAGGVVANFNLQDPATGQVEVVDWRAPALNTVLLRYSREEVQFILTYGRPGSPMPAWGVRGGGALNDQQIQNLIDYLEFQQITPEESQQVVADTLETYMAAEFEDGDPVFESEGEALFNLGLLDGTAAGAYSCARCHTAGWSYAESPLALGDDGNPLTGDDDQIIVDREAYETITANSGCGGWFGYNLCDGDTVRQFPADENPDEGQSPYHDMIDFITVGSQNGVGYGRRGQGSGKMPGYGQRTAEAAVYWLNDGAARDPSPGMMTPEQIESIVEYVRTLESTDGAAEESR